MLNVKRKILTTVWRAADGGTVTTYGKVNPVRMIRDGFLLVSQDLIEYQMTEEKFAETAKSEEEKHEFCKQV